MNDTYTHCDHPSIAYSGAFRASYHWHLMDDRTSNLQDASNIYCKTGEKQSVKCKAGEMGHNATNQAALHGRNQFTRMT